MYWKDSFVQVRAACSRSVILTSNSTSARPEKEGSTLTTIARYLVAWCLSTSEVGHQANWHTIIPTAAGKDKLLTEDSNAGRAGVRAHSHHPASAPSKTSHFPPSLNLEPKAQITSHSLPVKGQVFFSFRPPNERDRAKGALEDCCVCSYPSAGLEDNGQCTSCSWWWTFPRGTFSSNDPLLPYRLERPGRSLAPGWALQLWWTLGKRCGKMIGHRLGKLVLCNGIFQGKTKTRLC